MLNVENSFVFFFLEENLQVFKKLFGLNALLALVTAMPRATLTLFSCAYPWLDKRTLNMDQSLTFTRFQKLKTIWKCLCNINTFFSIKKVLTEEVLGSIYLKGSTVAAVNIVKVFVSPGRNNKKRYCSIDVKYGMPASSFLMKKKKNFRYIHTF